MAPPVTPAPPLKDPVTSTPKPTPVQKKPSPETPVLNGAIDGTGLTDNVLAALRNMRPVHFPDVPAASWSSSLIEKGVQIGFLTGYPNSTFKPKKNVSRAEFSVMLVKLLGLEEASSGPVAFSDVNGHRAQSSIHVLTKLGIIKGYDDDMFRPDRSITRAEIVTVIARVIDFGSAEHDSVFRDIDNHWAVSTINAMAEAGIIGRTQKRYFCSE